MPPTPIVATHRVIFKYTVDGLQHKLQAFCDALASADPLGWDLQGRPALGNVGLSLIPNAIADSMKAFYNPGFVTFDTLELWARTGTTYVFVTSAAPTVAPTSALGPTHAYQYAISSKDQDNKPLNTYLYETSLTPPTKVSSYTALAVADKALVDFYFAIGRAAVAKDAWNWKRSRGAAEQGRFVAVVIDTNEKLRRVRGIK